MTGLAIAVPPVPQQIFCDQCHNEVPSEHYHCLQCHNFDLCTECVRNSAQCRESEDDHYWIKRRLEDGFPSDMGSKVLSGTARAIQSTYPTWFQPPDPEDTPQSLFSSDHRFIRKSDPRQILIYTDGACLRNGQSNPQAGYSFVYRPSAYSETGSITHTGTIALHLETRGPTSQVYKQTSNRAELRAVIAALQFRDWSTDCNGGWRSLVFATDSEYVALNATQRIQRWESEGWKTFDQKTRQLADIKNQDLWKLLLNLIRTLQADGVKVSFWRIPRALNERADKFAKIGAESEEVPYFQMVKPKGPKAIQFKSFQC